jgi:putative ABC transport system permease protein
VTNLRLAFRTLAARPSFSLLVIVTLGLGIGANTAIFSAVQGLLLRDPPFREPTRLVRISSARGDEDGGGIAVPEFDDLRALPVIGDAALYTDQGMYNASGFGTPEELPATIATQNLFRVLGVEPMIGATFPPGFDRTRNFGLVISHGLWTRKFAQARDVVGRTMTLDGAPGYTIHGVMPADFNFPSHADLFRSNGISANPAFYLRRDIRDRMVVARLARNVTVEQARSAIDGLARRLEGEYPATNAGVRFRVTPMRDMYSATVRPYVLLLFGAVVLVLFVACFNVANLLLSRAIARDREIALRVALGATRWQIVSQLLVESLVLAAAGAVVGGALASWGVSVLTSMVPVQLPRWMQIQVNVRTGVFLAVTALITGVAAGLVPALRSTASPGSSLKEGARGSSDGGHQRRLRSALVIAEVALALVLLVGASLLLQSVARLHRVDLGFRTDNALTFRVELGWAAYGTLEKTATFHRRVIDRIRELPGVQAITFDNNLPMSGKPRDPYAVRVAGQSADQEARNPYVNSHYVGPDYFQVMGMRMVAGRGFDDRDRPDTIEAVVVSRRLADRLWPGQDAIGQRVQWQDATRPEKWQTVVGVVEPVLHHELDADPGFDMYTPFTQASTAGPYYVIRTAGDPMAIARAATAIIGQTDPNQSFLDVQIYDSRVANRIWQRRIAGALVGAFAALGLILAAVGLYGVLSYVVSQQRREIGVRMALGASSRNVIVMVLRRGLTLAGAGVCIGLVLAFGLARVVAGMLYEVGPADPLTFLAVPVVLLATAALACYLPARRAMRVDPIVALRE